MRQCSKSSAAISWALRTAKSYSRSAKSLCDSRDTILKEGRSVTATWSRRQTKSLAQTWRRYTSSSTDRSRPGTRAHSARADMAMTRTTACLVRWHLTQVIAWAPADELYLAFSIDYTLGVDNHPRSGANSTAPTRPNSRIGTRPGSALSTHAGDDPMQSQSMAGKALGEKDHG